MDRRCDKAVLSNSPQTEKTRVTLLMGLAVSAAMSVFSSSLLAAEEVISSVGETELTHQSGEVLREHAFPDSPNLGGAIYSPFGLGAKASEIRASSKRKSEIDQKPDLAFSTFTAVVAAGCLCFLVRALMAI